MLLLVNDLINYDLNNYFDIIRIKALLFKMCSTIINHFFVKGKYVKMCYIHIFH